MTRRVASSIALSCLALLAGCHCEPRVRSFSDTDELPIYSPSDVGASLTKISSSNPLIPSPAFKVVHRAVASSNTKTYYAMVSPWYPYGGSALYGRPDVRMCSFQQTWPVLTEKTGLLPGGGARGLGAAVSAAGTDDEVYDAIVTSIVTGTGWIYLSGDRPMVKTRRVIGAADGTTFFCQAAQRGTVEYYRFALLFPAGAPPTDSVRLALADSPGSTVETLTQALPYAVYSYDTSTSTGVWTPPQATIGTGVLWDDFQVALTAAEAQAALANLPVP